MGWDRGDIGPEPSNSFIEVSLFLKKHGYKLHSNNGRFGNKCVELDLLTWSMKTRKLGYLDEYRYFPVIDPATNEVTVPPKVPRIIISMGSIPKIVMVGSKSGWESRMVSHTSKRNAEGTPHAIPILLSFDRTVKKSFHECSEEMEGAEPSLLIDADCQSILLNF